MQMEQASWALPHFISQPIIPQIVTPHLFQCSMVNKPLYCWLLLFGTLRFAQNGFCQKSIWKLHISGVVMGVLVI